MLGKLMKHEFRATGRIMLPVLAAMVLLALLANLSIRGLTGGLSDIPVLRFIFILIVVFFGIGVVATGVMAVVIMVSRFYRNLLKDEGYLMLTLPVSVHGHIWSKLIVSMVWFLATGLVIFLVMSLTALNIAHTNLEMIIQNFPSWAEVRGFLEESGMLRPLIRVFLQGILMAIINSLTMCLHFYAAMSLGHMFSKDKVLLSVVFFIAISFLFNLMNTVYGGVMTATFSSSMELNEAMETASSMLNMMSRVFWHAILIQLIQGVVLYIATALGLKRGLNLG